jgi:hypothetical protein
MEKKDAKELATLTRVAVFLANLPPGTTAGDFATSLAELEEIVTELSAHAATQDTQTRLSRADTQGLAEACRKLREHQMKPIASAAAALLKAPAGYDKALRMPKGKMRLQVQIAAATAMGAAATPQAALLIQHGLAPDFLARLAAATAVVQAIMNRRAQYLVDRSGATQGVKSALKRGRVLKKMLNAIIIPAIEHDPVLLGAWRTAKGTLRPVTPIGYVGPTADAAGVAPVPPPSVATQEAPAAPPPALATTSATAESTPGPTPAAEPHGSAPATAEA